MPDGEAHEKDGTSHSDIESSLAREDVALYERYYIKEHYLVFMNEIIH